MAHASLPWRFASLFWVGEEERKGEREKMGVECAELSALFLESVGCNFLKEGGIWRGMG